MKRLAWIWILLAACNGGGDDDTVETPAWEEAFPATDVGWLLSAWGPAPDDVYAVGGAPDDGLIMHYDGTSWSELAGVPDVPLLNWGFGFGPGDITFVGNEGTVLHYDGSTFEAQPTPTTESLWGVWGNAPNDLWAVGGRGLADGQATILHYDGLAWTKSSTPTLSRPRVNAYFKVWGTATNDVYAVGQRGALVHWDGSAWTEIETGTGEDLVSLWGTGPNNIVVVGGRDNGVVVRYDGTAWASQSLAPLAGLNGVWMREPGRAHIGGVGGTLATLDVATLEYTFEDYDTFLCIHAMFGAGDRIFGVGGSLLSLDPPYRGVAVTRSLRSSE